MNVFDLSVVVVLYSVFIAGCMPRELVPGAEKIKLTVNAGQVAKKCKFLSDISVKNVHGDLSLTAVERYWVQDDVGLLKNAAKKAGANVVVLKKHERVVSREQERPGAHVSKKMHNHIIDKVRYNIDAKMYRCPIGVYVKELNAQKHLKH